MHQYSCPKCKSVLKRQEAVPTGKKIKCPKCETIFAPPATAVTGAAGGRAKVEDDWDRNPYAVTEENEEEEEARREEKQRAAAGVVKDRFKKSKRGPAQA